MGRGDNFILALLNFIINFYIFLYFVRIFITERERYDDLLGMVCRATDPVLRFLGSSFRVGNVNLAPLLVIFVLLILKGLLRVEDSILDAVKSFVNFLFQAYVLILIIIMGYREYYVNPITSFGQRLVNPIRAVAANFSRNLMTVNISSIVILVLLHTCVVFILNGMIGTPSANAFQHAFIGPLKDPGSLRLIVGLATFYVYAIIVNAVVSWGSPDPLNPLVQLLRFLTAPLVDPFRRFIPPLGGMLDISPIFAIFLLMFVVQPIGHKLLDVFGP